jgi:DNA-binding transcriptional MerR regulator
MSTTYRIAEVAQRSGFTPAALRYYEEIGLVAPAGRTDAG